MNRHIPDIVRGGRYALGATLVVAGVLLTWRVRSILVLIFLSLLLAAGLDPVVRRLQRLGLRRGLAVLVFLGGLIVGGLGFIALALTPAVAQLAELVTQLPNYLDLLIRANPGIFDFLRDFDVAGNLQKVLEQLPNILSVGLGIVSGVAGAIFTTLTVLALLTFFMLALPRMQARTERLLRSQERVDVFYEALGKVGGYMTGQGLISILAGIVAMVFLSIIGAPYPALLALVVAFFDLVPQVGAAIGAAIAVLVSATESLSLAFIVLVFFTVYQQLENYVIAPRVFSKTVNLTPLGAFIAVLIGASLGGFVGAIFALPMAAMFKTVLTYVYRDQLAALHVADDTPSLVDPHNGSFGASTAGD